VKVPTIRFYEKIGLLEEPPRTASDRRLYDGAATRRLAFIRHARQLGFEIDDIRALLALSDEPDRPCTEVNRIAERQLAAVETRIAGLQALHAELGGELLRWADIRLQSDRGAWKSCAMRRSSRIGAALRLPPFQMT